MIIAELLGSAKNEAIRGKEGIGAGERIGRGKGYLAPLPLEFWIVVLVLWLCGCLEKGCIWFDGIKVMRVLVG